MSQLDVLTIAYRSAAATTEQDRADMTELQTVMRAALDEWLELDKEASDLWADHKRSRWAFGVSDPASVAIWARWCAVDRRLTVLNDRLKSYAEASAIRFTTEGRD